MYSDCDCNVTYFSKMEIQSILTAVRPLALLALSPACIYQTFRPYSRVSITTLQVDIALFQNLCRELQQLLVGKVLVTIMLSPERG